MDVSAAAPIVVFDNHCYLCVKFARVVDFLARGRLTMVGHYSEHGKELRDSILDETALEMFWLVNEKNAYGGRAALLPLIGAIVSSKSTGRKGIKAPDSCSQECKTAKSVFLRSASLFSSSRKIRHARD